ncbi:MAG: hypothetical protein HGN29_18445 [Asgard group archaeon]|nr:hypothetical protein [Asgard group archaeon]
MEVTRKFKRLVVEIETPIAKTGNGPAVGGKVNNLLLLGNSSENNKENGKRYLVKGIRGWINHAMMAIAKKEGVEVCHTSDKTETQKGVNLLPEGFHANGECYPEKECIKHRLMGSIAKRSILKFEPVIIILEANSKGKKNTVTQAVHVATERRNALKSNVKISIQDFGERYFSGELTIKIEFLEDLTQEELGFLLKGILYAPELGLGASVNNGGGKVHMKRITLQEVVRSSSFGKQGKVIQQEKIRNLWKEMKEGVEAWPKTNA